MTPAEHAFLQAILASPDDDTPRLVYADWLQEQGREERAEFIRVQCKLAGPVEVTKEDLLAETWPGEAAARALERRGECWQCYSARGGGQHTNGPCRCSAAWKALCRREGELSTPVRLSAWLGFAGSVARWQPVYRRGFVESVACTVDDWLAHGPAIVACQPVREVRLTGRLYPTQNAELAAVCKGLRRVVMDCELDLELGQQTLRNTFEHACPGVELILPYRGVFTSSAQT